MKLLTAAAIIFVLAMAFVISGIVPATHASQFAPTPTVSKQDAVKRRDGQAIFRFDTFGDEQLWTDVLRMQEVIPRSIQRRRYWNSYVGIGQMGGKGTFSDPRIGLFIDQTPDLVTPKLEALLKYQLSLRAPKPEKGAVDAEAAERGKATTTDSLGSS